MELFDDLEVRVRQPLAELSLVASLLLAVVVPDPSLVRGLVVLRFAVPFATRHDVLLELNPSENKCNAI
jgi:hypothetical protein